MLRLVGILVGIRTAVPMGTEQYTPFTFRIIGADNVTRFQDGVVVSHQVGMLVVYLGAEFLQLLARNSPQALWAAVLGTRGPKSAWVCMYWYALSALNWGTWTVALVASPSLSLSAADLLLLLLHATIATISNSSNGMNV